MMSDQMPEETLYIVLCGKKVLILPCSWLSFSKQIAIQETVVDFSPDKTMTKRVC